MENSNKIRNIIEKNILEISSGVIGVNVEKCGKENDKTESFTIHTKATGEYSLDLYMRADLDTLRQISAKMKRQPPKDEEISMYVTEFFNIMGGRIVSEINKSFGKKAMIKPPDFSEENIPKPVSGKSVLTFYYSFAEGKFKVEGHLDEHGNF